ncbi:transcriptional regulator [Histidinibacterium aquaticum]|uniref:Transcriptional regulator n=1 Tax=Histidinibacterium aquaticum TaxID=2613962 RepID=A0A5J5GGC9_9RHOB|nr:transcriptional regulator [Histidinibacterium aquaticum]
MPAAGITRDRDQFLRELVRELAIVLEDTVGLEEAEGFISTVGNRIGRMMDADYRRAMQEDELAIEQVARVLVDLKARIEGGFEIERITPMAIFLHNTRCPFGAYVEGRHSLCMMTSSVFGRIAAANLGYARVVLEETIAAGDGGCRVVVHLKEGEGGREYYS